MFIIERMLNVRGLDGVHPMLKFIFSIGSLAAVLCAGGVRAPLLLFIVIVGASLALIRPGIGDYIKLMAVPGSFILLGSFAILLSVDTRPFESELLFSIHGFYLGIGKGGTAEALHVSARSFASAASMYFLILSTPQHEFDFILKTLKVPAVMRELCTLVYRNIFILIGMAESVYVAQRLRLGYANFPRSVRSSGGLISSVLIKSLDFGRRSYVAMRARGYTGEMAFVGGGYRFRFHHVLGTAGAGVLFIFIVIWSRS